MDGGRRLGWLVAAILALSEVAVAAALALFGSLLGDALPPAWTWAKNGALLATVVIALVLVTFGFALRNDRRARAAMSAEAAAGGRQRVARGRGVAQV